MPTAPRASDLIADLAAEYLLADRAYDTDAIVAEALAQGMEPVIPPRSNRREPREYDRYLYKLRHLVEKCGPGFQTMARSGKPAYAKNAASFLAICQIRAMVIWTKLF